MQLRYNTVGFFCKGDFTRSYCATIPSRFSKVNQPIYFSDTLVHKSDHNFQQHAQKAPKQHSAYFKKKKKKKHPPLKDRKWAPETQTAALKNEENQQAANASHVHAAPAPAGRGPGSGRGAGAGGRYFMAGAAGVLRRPHAACSESCELAEAGCLDKKPAGRLHFWPGPQAEALLLPELLFALVLGLDVRVPYRWGMTVTVRDITQTRVSHHSEPAKIEADNG